MTSLFMVLLVVVMFGALFSYESAGDNKADTRFTPMGLWTWLTSGNWPAKVGAGLLIIGFGALLRYAFQNIDIPAEMKLVSGVITTAVFGFASLKLKDLPARKAIHLALAGAAFGVAYMTAYSAYGFFNYINDLNALILLGLVSAGAASFAVKSNAVSVAVLAMMGAFLAPAFALGDPGVIGVYGYYVFASLLSAYMVLKQGWRPLIHLSFLFTFAGSFFFGWNNEFYHPSFFPLMAPIVFILTAIHLAMPLLEERHLKSEHLQRFDLVYFMLLPVTAVVLIMRLAPDNALDGISANALTAGTVMALALLWVGSTTWLAKQKKPEAIHHGLVALTLGVIAIRLYVHTLPWYMGGLMVSVAAIALAPRFNWTPKVREFLVGLAALFGFVHITASLFEPTPAIALANGRFAYRLLAAAILLAGAYSAKRQSLKSPHLLVILGGGWLGFALLNELLLLHLDFLPQLIYASLLLAVTAVPRLTAKWQYGDRLTQGLLCATTVCTWWAVANTNGQEALIFAIATGAVLVFLALTLMAEAKRSEGQGLSAAFALGLMPIAVLPWVARIVTYYGANDPYVSALAVIGLIATSGLVGRHILASSACWNKRLQPFHVFVVMVMLLSTSLTHIERGVLPVMFDLIGLIYVTAFTLRRSRAPGGVGLWAGLLTVLLIALITQAMLLRAFGPETVVMDATDLRLMHLPAAVSLMWVIFAAGTTYWGTLNKSRSIWSGGAVILVVAAAKLVFFDFGTLGQLGNIIAFIAAGAVFMGVAWFAPIPQKTADLPDPAVAEPSRPEMLSMDDESMSTAFIWFMGVAASIVAMMLVGLKPQNLPGFSGDYMPPPPPPKYRQTYSPEPYRSATADASAASAAGPGALRQEQANPQQVETPPAYRNDYQAQNAPAYAAPSVPVAAKPLEPDNACKVFVDKMPKNALILVGGGYTGSRNSAIFRAQDLHLSSNFVVHVEPTSRPVVLVLGAYEKSSWTIMGSTENVVGIIFSGYHEQTAVNLDKFPNVPVLYATYDGKSPCGYFYPKEEYVNDPRSLPQQLFGRKPDQMLYGQPGEFSLGRNIL